MELPWYKAYEVSISFITNTYLNVFFKTSEKDNDHHHVTCRSAFSFPFSCPLCLNLHLTLWRKLLYITALNPVHIITIEC